MTSFKIGQEVICIDDSNSGGFKCPVKKGQIMVIKGIQICSCGLCRLDFGIIPPTYSNICYKCEKETYNFETFFLRAERFRKLEYISATKEIVKNFNLTEEKIDVQIKKLKTI